MYKHIVNVYIHTYTYIHTIIRRTYQGVRGRLYRPLGCFYTEVVRLYRPLGCFYTEVVDRGIKTAQGSV